MKKILIFCWLFLSTGSYDKLFGTILRKLQQLLLDVEKLAQFKQIFSDLKKGYEIVVSGYSTVKNISQGNFNLHKTFLDGLMQVSPAVRKYKKVADIINDQVLLLKNIRMHLIVSRRITILIPVKLIIWAKFIIIFSSKV